MYNLELVENFCAICENNKNIKKIYPKNLPKKINQINYEGRKNPDKFHYEMVRCLNCNLLFAREVYKISTIIKLYENSEFNYNDEINGLKKTYFNCIKDLKLNNKNLNNLLDVGCGNGFLLEEAKKHGFKNVYGSEISKDAIDQSNIEIKKSIEQGSFETSNFKNEFFDIIFFAMVIEHFEDPNIFITKAYKLLKPGGYLVGVTHDEGHFLSKILKNKHPIINDEHVCVFDKQTLRLIFTKHNLKVIKINSLRNYYSLSYWIKMFPFPNFIKKFLFLLFKFLKIDRINIGIKAGNIFIISQKKIK